MKIKIFCALFAALFTFSPSGFAQDDLPVAKDANEDTRPAPPPQAEGEDGDEPEVPVVVMPTGRVAGAYEPTNAERNDHPAAQSLKIAQNGRALVPLVISTRATSPTRTAALELVEILEKITGAKFELQFSDGKPYDYPALTNKMSDQIRARNAAAARDLEFRTKPADALPQNGIVFGTAAEFEIPAELEEGLAMRGAFHGREAFAIRTNSKRVLLLANQERGLPHVVTRFLEELGHRRFGPGDHWEIVPKTANLSFQKDIADRPSIGSRLIAFMDGFNGGAELKAQGAWSRRNYIGTSFSGGVGHMWSKIILAHQAEIKEHPEYMALVGGERVKLFYTNKDGKEYIPKPTSDAAKLEMGSPVVRKWFVDYAVNYFKQYPDADMVSLSPNDAGGFSNSPESKALGNGSIPDAVYTMVNEVARALKKEFPGQGKMVGCYAYRETAGPPSFPLEDNVYIEVATLFNLSGYTGAQLLEMWPKKAKNFGVYRYFSYFDAGGSEIPGGPVASIGWVTSTIRADYARNTASIFAQSSNAFAMQMRGYLVASRLMWNPNADPDTILNDFYDKAFGPAQEPMKRFYNRLGYGSLRFLNSFTLAAANRDLDEATRLAKGREDILWRLADLKMYMRMHYLRTVWNESGRTPAYAKNYAALLRHFKAMETTYMAQTNMYLKRFGRGAPKIMPAAEVSTLYANIPPTTLESVETDFQAALKTMPTEEIPFQDFDLTDLVPVEFPPTPGLINAPAPNADGSPPMQREYFQGRTPYYHFYSFKGEPIEVQLQAGMRSQVQNSKAISPWSLFRPDGKGGWIPVATGTVLQDKQVHKISIPVPGPGSYGFIFSPGTAAGWLHYSATIPATTDVWGAKYFGSPTVYVPKGTKVIWAQGSQNWLLPNGKPVASTLNGNVSKTVVPPGMDGQVWGTQRSSIKGASFYNIPNVAAHWVGALMVPRAVAIKDGLKIREK